MEEINQHINNKSLWKRWRQKDNKKIIFIAFLFVLLVVLYVGSNAIFGNLLKQSVERASGYKYEFDFGTFRYNIFSNKLIFKNVSFVSISDSNTFQPLNSVEIDYFDLKGFDFFGFIFDKEIQFKELTINGTNVFFKTNRSLFPKQNIQDSTTEHTEIDSLQNRSWSFYVQRFFKKHAQKFGIEKFIFQDGNLHITNTNDSQQNIDIQNFNLFVEGILLNDSTLNDADSSFFFSDFEFNFGKNQWKLPFDSNRTNVQFDSLYYSSKNKTISSENLYVRSVQPTMSINADFPFFSIQNIDFEKLLNFGKFNFDTLQLVNTKLDLNFVEKQNNKKDDSISLQQLIQKYSPISLKHIALVNNYVNLNFDFCHQSDVHFQSFIDFYADSFLLNQETFSTQKRQLFCEKYQIHLSDAIFVKDTVFKTSFSDLKWGNKDRFFYVQQFEFQSLRDVDLKMIQLESFQLADVDLEKLFQEKSFETQRICANRGTIVLKNNKRKDSENQSFTFQLQNNEFAENIKIGKVDLLNINFESIDNNDKTQISIKDIKLKINHLNISQKKKYSIFDFKFCKNISATTEMAKIQLNDHFHELSWSSLSTDFDKKTRINNLSINTNDDPLQLIKNAIVLPATLIQAHSEIVEISEFNFGFFFKYGIVNVASLYSKNADIHVYKTDFSATKKQKNPISSVDVESIIFENGNFSFTDSDFDLGVNNFKLNIDILSIPDFNEDDVNYRFNNIVFEYLQQNFKTKSILLTSNGLKLNHQKEIFSVDNINYSIQQPQKALQNLKVNLNQLQIDHFDFLSLIYDKVFYANDLKIASTQISGLFNTEFKQPKDSISLKSLPQQVLIRDVELPDIQLEFSIIDHKKSQHHVVFDQSDLKMKYVNWMPEMKGFPHKGKMKLNLRNVVSELENRTKQVIVDSLQFSLLPNLLKTYGVSFVNYVENEVFNSFDFQKISAIAPNMDELVTNGGFKSEKILMNNGEIVLDVSSIGKNAEKNDTIQEKDSSKSIVDLKQLGDLLNQTVFNDVRIKLIQNQQQQTITLKNGVIDKNNGSSITIDALNFKINNNLADAGFKKVHINTKTQRIILDSCYLTPTLSKEEWVNHFDYQKDWTKVYAKSIILEGIDIEDFLNQTHTIPFVKINQLKLEDYRDKRKPSPENHFPLMPQDMLRNISRPFMVDSLIVTSSEFAYEEQIEQTIQPGKVFFTKARIYANHITNDSDFIKEPMQVNASMLLMDKVKLTTQLSFSLDDSTNYFTAAAQLEPFEMNILNPTLENLAFLSIKDGFCNGLEMNFHGNKIYSLGSMQFLYQDFKIGLIDKKKLKSDAGTNIVSFLANTFIVKRANPITIFPRNGIIFFERDPHKSIFNYLFKSSLMGIKHTIGLHESKAVKDKESEIYINYSQERKDIIKNYKTQKKEERKAIKESHKNSNPFKLWQKN